MMFYRRSIFHVVFSVLSGELTDHFFLFFGLIKVFFIC
jgi:hypothetical protein